MKFQSIKAKKKYIDSNIFYKNIGYVISYSYEYKNTCRADTAFAIYFQSKKDAFLALHSKDYTLYHQSISIYKHQAKDRLLKEYQQIILRSFEV